MCIIVYKREGLQFPDEHTLRNCFNANRDGAGYMYRYKDKIHIRKGFFTFAEFYKDLDAVDKKIGLLEHDVVLHFRIGTSGKIDAGRCHPFPISRDIRDLTSKIITCDRAMAHNGIISQLSAKGTDLSDTMYFAKKMDSKGVDLALEWLPQSSGKFIVMDKDTTWLDGDFISDKKILYSNTTYLYESYQAQDYSRGAWRGWTGLYGDVYIPKKHTPTPKPKTSKKKDAELKSEWKPQHNDGSDCEGNCVTCDELEFCDAIDNFEERNLEKKAGKYKEWLQQEYID